MNQQIRQIAERLKGLRDAIDISTSDIAKVCEISEDEYKKIETGDTDIPVSLLQKISQYYGIELSTLMFGNEAYMSSYYLTRAGKGPTVERQKAYKYQALAAGFRDRDFTPFMVTVEADNEKRRNLNSHSGEEFNYNSEGKMLLNIKRKELILHAEDAIYFDANMPHGMKALDGENVKFLAIII